MTQPPYNPNQGQPYPPQQPQQPQQTYQQNYTAPPQNIVYNNMPGGVPPQNQSNGAAVTSLVIGIAGVVLVCFCGLCLTPVNIFGLIMGFVGMGKPSGKGMAIWGVVLNIIAIILAIVITILAVATGQFDEMMRQIEANNR